MAKKGNRTYHKRSGKKPHGKFGKEKHFDKKQNKLPIKKELFDKYKDDLGSDYVLNDVFEIAYPKIETSIDVMVSGKPSDILQELHIFLLEAVSSGLDTKPELAYFLGVSENDFILDELYALLKEGLLTFSEDEKYRITTKGELFIEEQKFIPVTSQETFTFYVDGFTSFISTERIEPTNCENQLQPTVKVDHQFIQQKWMEINKRYSVSEGREKEIVDLANYKRSFVGRPKTKYYRVYALVYHPKDQSGKKIQIKVYSPTNKFLKPESATINKLFASNKFLFDFSHELKLTEDFKAQFAEATKEIEEEKLLAGKYKDISTFEHKELIKEALRTAEFAVYIESPWIKKATMNYLKEMKFFLGRKGTKLFIAHGIDSNPRNAPHKETFEEIQKLQQQYKDRFFLFHLPTHFQTKFPNRHGSHRKLLIKDYDFYVKGSFNWLSYIGDESESYAVEEGTQFFDNVQAFWQKVFSEYQLDKSLINF
ncbi:MAG: hypothetical protein D6730_04790 [Bacteroidetes bacterium]|nr:MAG: hypothetical protein D6730_04790 [Bacteroidota bacterium]